MYKWILLFFGDILDIFYLLLVFLQRFVRLPRRLWDLDSFADLKLEDEAESEERF